MKPTTDQVSMQVYGSAATYKESPNADETSDGVVPLDTLPAAWWNWLWNTVTKNNNASLLSISDLRTEMLTILEDAGVTPTASQNHQLLQAIEIIRKRPPSFDASGTAIPGAIISSADLTSVSVNSSTGKATVNALNDWTSTKTVKQEWATAQTTIQELDDTLTDKVDTAVTDLTDDVNDAIDTMENTITNRAHVVAVTATVSCSSTTAAITITYTVTGLVNGNALSTYTPQVGDMLYLATITDGSSTAINYHKGCNQVNLVLNGSTYSWSSTAFKGTVGPNQGGLMIAITGTASCVPLLPSLGPAYAIPIGPYIQNSVSSTNSGLYINIVSSISSLIVPYILFTTGDRIDVELTATTSYTSQHNVHQGNCIQRFSFEYDGNDWVLLSCVSYALPKPDTANSGSQSSGNLSDSTTTTGAPLFPMYWDSSRSLYINAYQNNTTGIAVSGTLHCHLTQAIKLNIGTTTVSTSSSPYNTTVRATTTIRRVPSAYYLNNTSGTSDDVVCTSDAVGNLYAHTLTLT